MSMAKSYDMHRIQGIHLFFFIFFSVAVSASEIKTRHITT